MPESIPMQEYTPGAHELLTKTGMAIELVVQESDGCLVYRLINPRVKTDRYMLYIHGGPNLSCKPYIEDTRTGGFRSLDAMLRWTNILMVDLSEKLESRKLPESGTKEAVSAFADSILGRHSPEHQAKVYSDILSKHLKGCHGGLFAQSFGAQILLNLLPRLEEAGFDRSYLCFGSPFLGAGDTTTFIECRRNTLKKRLDDLATQLAEHRGFDSIRERLKAVGLPDCRWHKVALEISHPAYPDGIILQRVERVLDEIQNMDDARFKEAFSTAEPDIVNFIVGSSFFTPGSNIHRATRQAVETDPLPDDVPDEAVWMLHEWEQQYAGTGMLEWTSGALPYSAKHNLELIEKASEDAKVFMVFEENDFMIPIKDTLSRYVSNFPASVKCIFREGYGHWVGHAAFPSTLGGLA